MLFRGRKSAMEVGKFFTGISNITQRANRLGVQLGAMLHVDSANAQRCIALSSMKFLTSKRAVFSAILCNVRQYSMLSAYFLNRASQKASLQPTDNHLPFDLSPFLALSLPNCQNIKKRPPERLRLRRTLTNIRFNLQKFALPLFPWSKGQRARGKRNDKKSKQ